MNKTTYISATLTLSMVLSYLWPYGMLEDTYESNDIYASELTFYLVPIILSLVITLLTVFWKNKAAVIVSFVLCFGVFFSFLLMHVMMDSIPNTSDYQTSSSTGFFIGVSTAILLFFFRLIHMVIEIKGFEKSKKQNDLIDN